MLMPLRVRTQLPLSLARGTIIGVKGAITRHSDWP